MNIDTRTNVYLVDNSNVIGYHLQEVLSKPGHWTVGMVADPDGNRYHDPVMFNNITGEVLTAGLSNLRACN